jgi:hypothetical protein
MCIRDSPRTGSVSKPEEFLKKNLAELDKNIKALQAKQAIWEKKLDKRSLTWADAADEIVTANKYLNNAVEIL